MARKKKWIFVKSCAVRTRHRSPLWEVRPNVMVVALCASLSAWAANTWYVDDGNYNVNYSDAAAYIDAGYDGTEPEKAFGTIQAAIDNPDCKNGDTIKVLPGIYDQGCHEEFDKNGNVLTRSRVYIDKRVNIIATGSKDETHIVGRFCPVEEGGNATYATGPTAVRCIRVPASGYGSTLTSFTIRDSATTGGTSTSVYNCGGAVSAGSKDFYVIDCVVSNAVTRCSGGAGYFATFIRCKIADCRAAGSAAALYASAAICSVITGCRLHLSYDSLAYVSLFCNCTFYGNMVAGIMSSNKNSSNWRNCLFLDNTGDEMNGVELASNVYASEGKDYSNACPLQLVDPAAGDFRPLKNSDVLGAGESRYLADDRFIDLPPGMELRDYCGNEIDLTGERIAAGACQVADPEKYGVKVDLDADNYNVSGCTPGEYVIASGASIRISRSANAIRHYGITVNGVTNLLDNGEYVYAPGTGIGKITGIIDPNWYVNSNGASGASDANDGFTAATAKLTLEGVLSVATNAGDVVHAAAGTYRDGRMNYNATYGDARAVISKNVTLVGDEGADATFIFGRAADDGNTYGQGEGALRCVMLRGGATVRGFTLVEGHPTGVGPSGISLLSGGGGAWADGGHYSARVVDCVISNCASSTGAAAFGVALFGTTMSGNRSTYSVATYCSLYGCLVASNSFSSRALYRCYDVYDTIVAPPASGKAPSVDLYTNTRICNSLVLGNCYGGTWAEPPRNCVFCGTYSNALDGVAVACVFTNRSAVVETGSYRPIVRGPGCETADASLLPDNADNAALLTSIRARRGVYNGGMDAGCYEADWRPCYTEDIAGRHLTVVAATSNVVETAERTVRIFPGNTLAAEWPAGQGARKFYVIRFRIVGDGRLSVTMNGSEQIYEGAGEHEAKVQGTLQDAAVAFAFSGDAGYADILSCLRLDGTKIIIR